MLQQPKDKLTSTSRNGEKAHLTAQLQKTRGDSTMNLKAHESTQQIKSPKNVQLQQLGHQVHQFEQAIREPNISQNFKVVFQKPTAPAERGIDEP